MSDHPESARQDEQGVTSRMLWFAVLAGPIAWLLDESIALTIEAGVCGGSIGSAPGYARPLLVSVALVAIVTVGAAMMSARRSLRATEHPGNASRHAGRVRFMALSGLLIGTLALFGIVLRLVASLVSPVCA